MAESPLIGCAARNLPERRTRPSPPRRAGRRRHRRGTSRAAPIAL